MSTVLFKLTFGGGFCSGLIRLILGLVIPVQIIALDVVHIFALSFIKIIINLELLGVNEHLLLWGRPCRPSVWIYINLNYQVVFAQIVAMEIDDVTVPISPVSQSGKNLMIFRRLIAIYPSHFSLTKASITHFTKLDSTNAFWNFNFCSSALTPFWLSSSDLLPPAAFFYSYPQIVPAMQSETRCRIKQRHRLWSSRCTLIATCTRRTGSASSRTAPWTSWSLCSLKLTYFVEVNKMVRQEVKSERNRPQETENPEALNFTFLELS